MNQIWGDFHRRIAEPRFSGYWDGFRQYLLHQHEISGRAEDALVAFDVWYIWEIIPPPGLPTQAPERRKLFSYGFVQP
jgi:hypothetical protein